MTIQEIINAIIAAVPGAPFPQTVDTIKSGDASQECTGIVTTFLASVDVIERAAALKANLIVTHEPTFYNHHDNAKWTADNRVVAAKRKLLEQYGIVIWRFHDTMHSIQPDPTILGLIQAMGWEGSRDANLLYSCCITPLTVRELAAALKQKLDLPSVRVVGDLDMICQTIAILPGIPPTEMQIGVFDQPNVDALICGEVHEWETPEYSRDALRLGSKKALFVIGHAASEEPGMRRITEWLQEKLPDQSIIFVPTGTPFQLV